MEKHSPQYSPLLGVYTYIETCPACPAMRLLPRTGRVLAAGHGWFPTCWLTPRPALVTPTGLTTERSHPRRAGATQDTGPLDVSEGPPWQG